MFIIVCARKANHSVLVIDVLVVNRKAIKLGLIIILASHAGVSIDILIDIRKGNFFFRFRICLVDSLLELGSAKELWGSIPVLQGVDV